MTEPAPKKSNGKTLVIGGLIIIIILLLLWWKRPKNVRNDILKYGDVVLDGPRYSDYNVPGLKVADIWDWIHATDLGIMPGLPIRKAQIQPLSFDPVVLPVMVYVNKPTPPALPSIGQMPPAPEFDFEPWTAPARKKYWYRRGYNTNETVVTFVQTEDGAIGYLGNRKVIIENASDSDFSKTPYPNQYSATDPNGGILFLNGQSYDHDASRDNYNYKSRPMPMAWG